MATPALLLASASPRRRELLALLRRPFDVDPADVDESVLPGEDALTYVERVARAKAEVALGRHPDRLVIAADTTVDLDGAILAKPLDDADARRMLRSLSGRDHRVHTRVVVAARGFVSAGTATTRVRFDDLTDDDVDAYVATGEPLDKAGAYAIQGGAAAFVTSVQGSVTNIVGLPLAELRAMLAHADDWFASAT